MFRRKDSSTTIRIGYRKNNDEKVKMNNNKALQTLSKAKQYLAKAKTFDEFKQVRDISQAAMTYMKTRREYGLDCRNDASEIVLRAERRMGEMLAKQLKHGGDRKSKSRCQHVTLKDMEISKKQSERWQAEASLPEEKFEKFLEETRDSDQEITQAKVIQLAKQSNGHKSITPIAPPKGKYRCIVIDPPWPVKKIERLERPMQGLNLDYPIMSLEEIEILPIKKLSFNDGCHLYLWVTHKYLPTGLGLVESWGFKYQCLMTWVKPTGMTPYSWMYNTEHVIYATKGNLKLEKFGVKLSFEASVKKGSHSEKPDVFYERIKQCSPEPRIDLFARKKRDGYRVWGNEVGS